MYVCLTVHASESSLDIAYVSVYVYVWPCGWRKRMNRICKQFVINKMQYAWLPHLSACELDCLACVCVCVPVYVSSRERRAGKACKQRARRLAIVAHLHACMCRCIWELVCTYVYVCCTGAVLSRSDFGSLQLVKLINWIRSQIYAYIHQFCLICYENFFGRIIINNE